MEFSGTLCCYTGMYRLKSQLQDQLLADAPDDQLIGLPDCAVHVLAGKPISDSRF